MRVKLKYIKEYVDQHGRAKWYFRRNGKLWRLSGLPGSPEFMAAYSAAAAEAGEQAGEIASRKKKPAAAAGTFDKLAQDYFASRKYRELGEDTRRAYRGVIERLMPLIGPRQVDQMQPKHVDKLLAQFVDRPGAGTEALKKLRILYKFAMRQGWTKFDPTVGTERFKGGEFHTWNEDEIAQYEAHWPLGSRERTALALQLFTGQRRSDAVAMLWLDIGEGGVRVAAVGELGDGVDVVQRKTGEKLWIPMHAELVRVLEAWRPNRIATKGARVTALAPDGRAAPHGAILTTGKGEAFSPAGYGNWFRENCRAAGLPDRCSSHGLRKAAGRRLAEAGCSTREIMAVLGLRSLDMAEKYTRGADQKRLATSAIAQLDEHKRQAQTRKEDKA